MPASRFWDYFTLASTFPYPLMTQWVDQTNGNDTPKLQHLVLRSCDTGRERDTSENGGAQLKIPSFLALEDS